MKTLLEIIDGKTFFRCARCAAPVAVQELKKGHDFVLCKPSCRRTFEKTHVNHVSLKRWYYGLLFRRQRDHHIIRRGGLGFMESPNSAPAEWSSIRPKDFDEQENTWSIVKQALT